MCFVTGKKDSPLSVSYYLTLYIQLMIWLKFNTIFNSISVLSRWPVCMFHGCMYTIQNMIFQGNLIPFHIDVVRRWMTNYCCQLSERMNKPSQNSKQTILEKHSLLIMIKYCFLHNVCKATLLCDIFYSYYVIHLQVPSYIENLKGNNQIIMAFKVSTVVSLAMKILQFMNNISSKTVFDIWKRIFIYPGMSMTFCETIFNFHILNKSQFFKSEAKLQLTLLRSVGSWTISLYICNVFWSSNILTRLCRSTGWSGSTLFTKMNFYLYQCTGSFVLINQALFLKSCFNPFQHIDVLWRLCSRRLL